MTCKIDLSKSPESNCPRFEICQINKCPLHKDFEKLENDVTDPSKIKKEKCTSKKVRREIGRAFGLKNCGLTSRERSGYRLVALNNINFNLHGQNGTNSPQTTTGADGGKT